METKLKLESDLKDALRAGDNLRKNTLRLAGRATGDQASQVVRKLLQ